MQDPMTTLTDMEQSSLDAIVTVVETDVHRALLSGTTVIGMEYKSPHFRFQAVFAAMALMQVVSFLEPRPERALCLGLGAGTAPHFFRASGIHTDVIEYDAAVINLASRHFVFGADHRSFTAGGRVIHADAIQSIEEGRPHGDPPYDLVLSDLWSGGNQGAALQLSYFEKIRSSWLTPNGTFALNVVGFPAGPHASFVERVVRTMRAVFSHVHTFLEFDPHKPGGFEAASSE